jgi:peptidoglycan/xylan/chitin deacetylase (PgdA/CDA1 family)
MIPRRLSRPARRAFGHPMISRAALVTAAARRRGLVLVFHRVTDDPEPSTVVVPTVSRNVLRAQVEFLLQVGTVVPLASLLTAGPVGRGPRFALTFDDDSISHHAIVLPLLRELGVAATFFLSGRALHGLGPPWFEILDALIREHGSRAAATRLGLSTADEGELAASCENDRRLQHILEGEEPRSLEQIGEDQIRDLRDAGMTIGFHTLRHRILVGCEEAEVDAALHEGRADLEALVGRPLRLFAYPHGKADRRVARRVRLAGYDGAWTGRPRPVTPSDDRHLLGRWESGPIVGRDFRAKVAVRTNGWGGR